MGWPRLGFLPLRSIWGREGLRGRGVPMQEVSQWFQGELLGPNPPEGNEPHQSVASAHA